MDETDAVVPEWAVGLSARLAANPDYQRAVAEADAEAMPPTPVDHRELVRLLRSCAECGSDVQHALKGPLHDERVGPFKGHAGKV